MEQRELTRSGSERARKSMRAPVKKAKPAHHFCSRCMRELGQVHQIHLVAITSGWKHVLTLHAFLSQVVLIRQL